MKYLAIVESAFDGYIVDVLIKDGCHLGFLNR